MHTMQLTRDTASKGGSATQHATVLFAEQGRWRLQLLALIAGALALGELLVTVTAFDLLGVLERPEADANLHVMQVGVTLLSAGLYFAAQRVVDDRHLMRLALAYQVASALLFCTRIYWGDAMLQVPIYAGFTPLAVWIILFPLIVPAPPLTVTWVSLLCATTGPVTQFLWLYVEGRPVPKLPVLLQTFLPVYVSVGLAVVPAMVIHRLTAKVVQFEQAMRELGSYRLISRLGVGGMGEVWRAEHRLLARPAAIKLIKADVLEEAAGHAGARDELLQRFEREARAAAALESPHSIVVYDYGIGDDETFYYVMELLDGVDLWTLVRRFGPLSPPRVIHLLSQACEALEEAHRAGMVHRDIKPANIFVCRRGTVFDFVKVLDFGLVSLHSDPVSGSQKLTQRGFVVGTPAFMAPEQTEAQSLDARADIYALGCVAYWLLTGHQVFEEEDISALMRAHLAKEPAKPSELLGRDLPPDLEYLVMRCLSKDADERPRSCAVLLRQLLRCKVEPAWSRKDAERWWRMHLPKTASQRVRAGKGAAVTKW